MRHQDRVVPRRRIIRAGLGVAGALSMPGFVSRALADDHAPLGTWITGIGEFATYLAVVPSIGRVSGAPDSCGNVNVAVARSTSAAKPSAGC